MFPCRKNAQAKIVHRGATPCLLAIFDASAPPMIWQFDLEKMANYTMTLREKDGEWELGVALPQGTFTKVAQFDERSEAEAAYAAVRKAMIKGSHAPMRLSIKTVFAIALVVFGLFFFGGLGRKITTNETSAPSVSQQQTQPENPNELLPGIPMSADDVLTPPQE